MLHEETTPCKWTRSLQMIVKKRSESRPIFYLSYSLKAAARQVEEFYSPGSLELLESRRRLAEFSLPRLGFRYYPAVMVN